MPQITGSLLDGKPIVSVALSQALPVPSAVGPQVGSLNFDIREYRALIDTGADITCLCDHVVRECRLEPFGIINMTSGNGENRHMSHLIHLGIWCEEMSDFEGQNDVKRTLYQLPDALVAASIRDNAWFDVIIGTDVISQHEFTLKKGGTFELNLG